MEQTADGLNVSAPPDQEPRAKKKRKGLVSTLIVVLVLLVGVGILAYPTVANWWNSFHQSRAIASYVAAVEDMSAEEKQAMLEAARAYNATLVGNSGRYTMTPEQEAEYEALLDTTGTGIMGYCELPTVGEKMAIYHGVDEAILQVAVGHMPGTSLPVGGTGVHTMISGHTGLPSARLFTDIDQFEPGDLFYFHVLGETYAYEVDQSIVVLPEEMEALEIDPNGDFATLVTCTPYGVNSHRLLVRGHRVPVPETFEEMPEPVAVSMAPYVVGSIVGAIVLVTAIVVLRRRAKKKASQA